MELPPSIFKATYPINVYFIQYEGNWANGTALKHKSRIF